MDGTAGAVQLGHAGAGFHEDVHDGNIGLKTLCIKTFYLNVPEDGSGHQERSGAGPVGLDGKIGRLVALASLNVEVDAGTKGPILRFQEVVTSFHLGTHADAELFQDIYRDKKVRNAARIVNIEGRFFLAEGQGSEQSRNEL